MNIYRKPWISRRFPGTLVLQVVLVVQFADKVCHLDLSRQTGETEMEAQLLGLGLLVKPLDNEVGKFVTPHMS